MTPSSGREPMKLAVISALFLITRPDELIILPRHTQENMTTSTQGSTVVYGRLYLSDEDIKDIKDIFQVPYSEMTDKEDEHGMDRDDVEYKKMFAEKTQRMSNLLGGSADKPAPKTHPAKDTSTSKEMSETSLVEPRHQDK
jgi:hypothetical protein